MTNTYVGYIHWLITPGAFVVTLHGYSLYKFADLVIFRGKPTCIWYVMLKLKVPGPNPMVVLDSSGKYEPGEGGWLSIAFKPTMEMTYDAILIFRFHMNPTRLTIPITGKGIIPHVHIIGPEVNFSPTLPWAETNYIFFGLTNPCPFPLELIIAHTDNKWVEEEEMYNLLYKYYNKPDEMLVPAMRPGAGWPSEIIHFYKRFNDNVKKTIDEEAAAMKATPTRAAAKKPAKSPKGAKVAAAAAATASPRKFRTEAEIIAGKSTTDAEIAIIKHIFDAWETKQDAIDEMKILKDNDVDPIRDCLERTDRAPVYTSTEKTSKGMLIFVHGSPCEEVQCQEMAHSVGKSLGLPTINFDASMVEALCDTKCSARTILLSSINETYDLTTAAASKTNSNKDFEGSEDYKPEEEVDDSENTFEVIWKKLEYVATCKVGTPRSKASDKKKMKKSTTGSSTASNTVTAMGSSTMFNMELIQQLLTEFFRQPRFRQGFVVDSLTSIILKNPGLVITTFIRCKHSIKNIHLVLCQSDFSKWAQAYEDAQREHDLIDENQPIVYDEDEIDSIVQDCEKMDAHKFDKASPEIRQIYIIYGLEARRRKHYLKLGYPPELAVRRDKTQKGDISKSVIAMDGSESKKKITKKEELKGAKQTSEYIMMNTRYNEYSKVTYDNLINIANNWIIDECDVGVPLYGFNGQVVGAGQRKIKKKSEIQLQTSSISFEERGFPLTLIMCPCNRYKKALVKMFKKSPLVIEALREEPPFDILKCPVKTREYTVLLPKTFPEIKHEKPLKWRYLDEPIIRKCECNQLTDLNLLDDTSQDNVLNILSKWHCTCGKKVASSQTSTSEIPSESVERVASEDKSSSDSPLPLRAVTSLSTPADRLVLQPGDLVRCKYAFSPRDEGTFSVKRYVEVSGWPESRVVINVSGICDLPRIDSRPKKMFENFVRRTLEDNVYKSTYLDDQKIFEFGPIFVGANRIYEEQYNLDLKNSSLITTEIEIQFLEDTTVFQIDKEFIRLEPGCRDKLNITAAPSEVGVYRSVLLFCVKDNPEIVEVNIGCSGVVPDVQILPLTKQIEYGKLLLYRREDDRFIVKNDSILPIMWKIRNAQEFTEDFIIAETKGIVPRHDNHVVPVTYIACRVGVISHKCLVIDIYDEEGRGDPMVVDMLFLSAECYDVLVECAYENPSENFLNYGNVKVNTTVYREMYLLNRGKYPIYFKLKKVKNFPEPSLLKTMTPTQETGIIPAMPKLVSIEFECMPITSMNLVNVPAFICSLLDGSKDQVVVAKFPVCITIASFYNTFTLFPLGELNFHIIPIGTAISRDVILNNTSKCPVTYEIILPPEYRPDPDAPQPMAKGKENNKIKALPLKCGNFVIANDDNLLAPGTSRTLQIQFFATAPRKFEETINFVISDTCPAEAQGVPLKLVGIGALPTLDFWNIETTFREHMIIKSLAEYTVPESSPHCVFVEDSVTLHFFCVTVNTCHKATIDLYNNGLVACALTMKLHYQSNSNPAIFSLDKYDTHIEPLLHKNLVINFTPKALEEYRAVLEIKLKLLGNQEQTFKICLIGEGVIPRIEVIIPNMKQRKLGSLLFPVTCLGSVTNKKIVLRNLSSVKIIVKLKVFQTQVEERSVFWLTASPEQRVQGSNESISRSLRIKTSPNEKATIQIHFNPIRKGRAICDIRITIIDNPYEMYTVFCEAEAFMEDVILTGIEMLSMETDLDKLLAEGCSTSTSSTATSRKKSKSATFDKNKRSRMSVKTGTSGGEGALLKYILDFGGCELCTIKRRSIIMVNNSEKVYKFKWDEVEYLIIKPSVGYISPGEEKDLEIMFFSREPVTLKKNFFHCSLVAVSDDSLSLDIKGSTWDNRQTITMFDYNKEVTSNERYEGALPEPPVVSSHEPLAAVDILIVFSAATEYSRFTSTLKERQYMNDTYIYQTRSFDFTVKNTGRVMMKLSWDFVIDEEFPSRIDKANKKMKEVTSSGGTPTDEGPVSETAEPSGSVKEEEEVTEKKDENTDSRLTLFSGSAERESVDTWFEIDMPFTIEPCKVCLKANQTQTFNVTFAPVEAFVYNVRLKSCIDNLDPYDQNLTCKIVAKSSIPYCHLDIEDSDYLTGGRRKAVGVALPKDMIVLEFNVLGSGCYKKSFNVVNPTNEGYEFIFEMILADTAEPELIPMHCNMLKGFVEGGTSVEVTFTFSPTGPGVYESQWRFLVPVYNLTLNLLAVGLVREPDVAFVPTIMLIRNSLVGFTTTTVVTLKNPENESLKFQFKGNSLCNESGKTPVIVQPEEGILRARSETPIKVIYTPIQDGPLSFKIFCSITYLTKFLTLCVNALSHSIKPKVTYYLTGNKHILNSEAVTNIHLDQTASTYERTIPFKIKNDGSATFFFEWRYTTSSIKKYVDLRVEPRTGHVASAKELECTVFMTLRQVPMHALPITLTISDGPEYSIFLHAEIEKPLYNFSCKEFDFGKCIINAPDTTYKKNIAFTNDDKVPIIIDLNFNNLPELVVDYVHLPHIEPQKHLKISIYFRPKQVKEYEFQLEFWVNSLCKEIITVRGEGIPLLFDLYEGCQKSFDLGPVKVGEKIIKSIEVMNHSKIPIDASFIFRDMYPYVEDEGTNSERTSVCLSPSNAAVQQADSGPSRVCMLENYRNSKVRNQIAKDITNALDSLKVLPNKAIIKPHRKVSLKIQFKPVGMISDLNVQLNMKVLNFERPLVRLSGSATGMSLCLNQNSLQFGRVRRRGCKIQKVMLLNKGDFGATFWWQPIKSDEFVIAPMQGNVAARSNVTFTITFRPKNHNPFIKVWASCNIENYKPLELAMYAACVDTGTVLNKTIYFDVPVREVERQNIVVTNPTDDVWLVLSEVSGGPFETPKEFDIEPNTTYEIPIDFKPKTMGKHEAQVLFSPLGESALFVTLIGNADQPNPNGVISFTVFSKQFHMEELNVFNITEFPESYVVTTELHKVIPDKFEGNYEITHPETIKVWGEAAATCRWNFICYEPCEMQLKVMLTNEKSREYQFYMITATVKPCEIVATITFESRARESVQREVIIKNPLSSEAVFTVKCDRLQCPDTLKISRNSEATLTLTYAPLVVGLVEEVMEVSNHLVGTYHYQMVLKCKPAKEKNLEYTTCFGTAIPLRLRVHNKTDVPTNFIAEVTHPSIATEKDYSLNPNEKGKFLVWFEPTDLGEQLCKVSFMSPVAGEFVFNIKGIATDPKPQGPIEIKAGGFGVIKFKNVYTETKMFKVFIDSEDFYVKVAYEPLKPKKDMKIAVYMTETTAARQQMPTGCLSIESNDPSETKVQWTYFLQGIP